jgi:ADP-heptose:LPS heptosyltransferase
MKILVIRLSAIGDIVLTTPILRCLKKQLPDAELHFLVQPSYKEVIAHNPYIDAIHELEHNWLTTINELKNQEFDYIIDLQNNKETQRLAAELKVPVHAVKQHTLEKTLFIRLKWNVMPKNHVVDQGFKAIAPLGVKNDGAGLDYFIPRLEEVPYKDIPLSHHAGFIAMVIGASFFTKRLPVEKWKELCAQINHPIILLGGKEAYAAGEEIRRVDETKVYNACGKFTLNESADLVRKSKLVIAHDTGLMHIAAAFKKPIIVIWGSTIPSLGMTPYYGNHFLQSRQQPPSDSVQVHKLWCRPCTTVGRHQCPQGHFKCMKEINVDEIVQKVNTRLQATR